MHTVSERRRRRQTLYIVNALMLLGLLSHRCRILLQFLKYRLQRAEGKLLQIANVDLVIKLNNIDLLSLLRSISQRNRLDYLVYVGQCVLIQLFVSTASFCLTSE